MIFLTICMSLCVCSHVCAFVCVRVWVSFLFVWATLRESSWRKTSSVKALRQMEADNSHTCMASAGPDARLEPWSPKGTRLDVEPAALTGRPACPCSPWAAPGEGSAAAFLMNMEEAAISSIAVGLCSSSPLPCSLIRCHSFYYYYSLCVDKWFKHFTGGREKGGGWWGIFSLNLGCSGFQISK